MRLDHLSRSLSSAASVNLSKGGGRLASLAGKLDAMSPLRVIARGYAITTKHEQPITSVTQVSVGDPLSLRLSDGRVMCTVLDTEKEESATYE